MDKNVGSVDIEELKRAREELNRERGIESDPNMYSNYNPEAHQEDSNESVAYDDEVTVNPEETASETEESNESLQQEELEKPMENVVDHEVSQPDETVEEQQTDSKGESLVTVSYFDDNQEDKAEKERTGDQANDLSVYDSFSAFEVNSGVTNTEPVIDEDVNEFCHRRLIADYIELETGIYIPEVSINKNGIIIMHNPIRYKNKLISI